jgi:hypothetical protein
MSYDENRRIAMSGGATLTECQRAKILDILQSCRSLIGVKPEVPTIKINNTVLNSAVSISLKLGETSFYPIIKAELTGANKTNTGNYVYWLIKTPNTSLSFRGSIIDLRNYINKSGTYSITGFDKGIYNPTFISNSSPAIIINVQEPIIIMNPPTNIQATDGTYTDRVYPFDQPHLAENK